MQFHAPSRETFSIDSLARPDDGHDRWGGPGRRTVFLASDSTVALAEYARQREPGAPDDRRCLYTLRLQAVATLDLRSRAVLETLGLEGSSRVFIDRVVARQVATAIRDADLCQGLIVPSVAFLDRPERFNVVLFAERLGVDLDALLRDPEVVGEVRLGRT
jgi:hypothetical protein